MKKLWELICLVWCPLAVMAVQPIDLKNQDLNYLLGLHPLSNGYLNSQLKITHSDYDFNNTKHIRIKQVYKGYPVIRGDIIVHIRNALHRKTSSLQQLAQQTMDKAARMNGVIYQNIDTDLINTPQFIFTQDQQNKALEVAMVSYQGTSTTTNSISHKSAQLMVYIDNEKQAHWVYWINFYIPGDGKIPELPGFLLDALNFKIYHQWSEISHLEDAKAGGYGGNDTISMLTYDDEAGNKPAFTISRDADLSLCYMSNEEVRVKDLQNKNIVNYPCATPDVNHNNIYWNGALETVNGGYSPANDAFYAATMTRKMFKDWYHIPPITQYGKPLASEIQIHLQGNNAFWDPVQMAVMVGDGGTANYPFTSLDIIAHEIAHGFTIQHSHIVSMDSQSGGIVESFSDITGQAVQYYVRGENNWMVAHENQKSTDPKAALRYLDNPPRDGASIDNWKNYNNNLGAHLLGGIFNKAFYLLATTPGWDVHRAYNVWLQANRYYWLPLPSFTSFGSAACGILSASEDFSYDKTAIRNAFSSVGIDTSGC
jgi:Zn-dependent metalloprotease